jgi:hypothetical protein
MICNDYTVHGDGFALTIRRHPSVRYVIGSTDAVLGQVRDGAGVYGLLGLEDWCYFGRAERCDLGDRIAASIRERRRALGGIRAVLTMQCAVRELPWTEHHASVLEAELLHRLPQRLLNERRSHWPRGTTQDEKDAAQLVRRYVDGVLRSRGYMAEQMQLIPDTCGRVTAPAHRTTCPWHIRPDGRAHLEADVVRRCYAGREAT